MHSFRLGGSLSKALAGTAVDEIVKIGGWRTESIAECYIGATSTVVDKCRVARGTAARAPPTLASYHCRESFSPRVREIIEATRQCWGNLGETTLHVTSGQPQIQSNGATKYERDHGPAQEASSNPTITLIDPRY